MPQTQTLEMQNMNLCRGFQELYDRVLEKIGAQAPAPMRGQDVIDYRVETCRTLKRTYIPQSEKLSRVNFRGLRNDTAALQNFEAQLLQAVPIQAHNPLTVPLGEMRRIPERDEFGQIRAYKWIGQESFIKDMGRPGRRVVSFNTPNGPVNASGMFLR
jgi:hypothetical protein